MLARNVRPSSFLSLVGALHLQLFRLLMLKPVLDELVALVTTQAITADVAMFSSFAFGIYQI
jgi:hypothetical protein